MLSVLEKICIDEAIKLLKSVSEVAIYHNRDNYAFNLGAIIDELKDMKKRRSNMLTHEDRILIEDAIELLGMLLELAIDLNNHGAASNVGAIIDGLKDIKNNR